jgi:hypothetical protein
VVEFVRRGIAAKQELQLICENMMDNCLASNSETGGVGCDNMTMTVVALLQGKTKEEWYDLVAKRVADGDGPCAPPEYGKLVRYPSSVDRANFPQLNSVAPVSDISMTTTAQTSTSSIWISEPEELEIADESSC